MNKLKLMLAASILLVSGQAGAAVLTFDDIAFDPTLGDGIPIVNGYGGFDWTT